jgi:hypothetical protein
MTTTEVKGGVTWGSSRILRSFLFPVKGNFFRGILMALDLQPVRAEIVAGRPFTPALLQFDRCSIVSEMIRDSKNLRQAR